MKQFWKTLCVALLTVLPALPATCLAQEKKDTNNVLTIEASIVARGELRYGGLPSADGELKDKARFVVERTRLGANYKRKWLEAKVTLQQAGVWGDSNTNSLSIYEAWGKLTANNGLFLSIGRQELSYDDERIIGSDDWVMVADCHDVLKLGYEGHGHKAHFIFAYNQTNANTMGGTTYTTQDGEQPYKSMITGWYHYDLPHTPLGASLLFMNMAMQSPYEENAKTESQQLLGGFVSWQPDRWNIEGAYYRQMGKDEFHTPIEAWMASAKVEFSPTTKWTISTGYDYLSGDPNPVVPKLGELGMARHDKVRGFSTVFGSHHKFYGAMDFFYVDAYYGGYTPGLQNLYANFQYSPIDALKLSAGYHYFATASKISNASRSLGHELELSASYYIIKDVKLSFGYSYMHGTSTLERLHHVAGKNKLNWAWLAISFSPKFPKIKW